MKKILIIIAALMFIGCRKEVVQPSVESDQSFTYSGSYVFSDCGWSDLKECYELRTIAKWYDEKEYSAQRKW